MVKGSLVCDVRSVLLCQEENYITVLESCSCKETATTVNVCVCSPWMEDLCRLISLILLIKTIYKPNGCLVNDLNQFPPLKKRSKMCCFRGLQMPNPLNQKMQMKIRNRSRFDASIHAAEVRAMSSCTGTVVQPVCISHKAGYLVISKQGVPQRQLETTLSVPHTTSITFVFLCGLCELSHLQQNSI